MAVPKSKQTLSDMEFYNTAITIRKSLTLWLLKDFGFKNKVLKATSIKRDMSDEDAKVFDELLEKYQCTYITGEYPEWLVGYIRENILTACENLISNIIHANSIYAMYESEYYQRRNFQNAAIGDCQHIHQELVFILSLIPSDANKYMKFVDAINKEIALIKGWRKSDNKILKKIRDKQNKQNKQEK